MSRPVTPEEAETFRQRVKRQNDSIAQMLVIDIDDFINFVESRGRTFCEEHKKIFVDGHCPDCGEAHDHSDD